MLFFIGYIIYYIKNIKIPESTTGKIIKGLGLANKLNFPTVNLRIDNPVPCGIYLADTKYGKITMIVGNELYYVECNFHNFTDEIIYQESITITNIQRIQVEGTLSTFYKGCV